MDDAALIQKLTEERDNARFLARAAYQLIEEGCFCDEIEWAPTDTPEWELWIKKICYQDLVYYNPWVNVDANG